MMDSPVALAAALSDHDLIEHLPLLARRERGATVELVAHLAELDARKLYLGLGYGSLFGYCTGALRLAEHAAYNRIEAARLSRRVPRVLVRLADGTLNLSSLRLLAPHLTAANCDGVLDEASGRSKRDVEALVARLAPAPDVRATVRKVAERRAATAAARGDSISVVGPAAHVDGIVARGEIALAEAAPRSAAGTPGSPPAPQATPTRRPEVAALSPGRYRLQCTLDREAHANLRHLQDLLRREIPDGDPGRIVARALKLLRDDVARRKLAATAAEAPRRAETGKRARPTTGSRHVPAHVRRGVWQRDGGQCAFVGRLGQRCRERAFLELHHVEPYAIGGEATLSNLSLRCRAHNAYEARLVFGPSVSRPQSSEAGGPGRGMPREQLAPGRVAAAMVGERGTVPQ